MDKFCITLEISSPEIKKRGESKIGTSISTFEKYKKDDGVKEKVVFRLFQEICYILENLLEVKIYTDSFEERLDSLYEDYYFDQPKKVEENIRRMVGELFDSSMGIIAETCEAKYICDKPSPMILTEEGLVSLDKFEF